MATGEGQFDWAIRFTVVLLLIFTFTFILLPPLWKLTMSRSGLIIVFSRAIGNYIRLIGFMPTFIVANIFHIPLTPDKPYTLAYQSSMNCFLGIMTIVPHVHNLALAVNRSHAIFFPFHYSMLFANKKKKIYALCLCLWLICICVGSSNYFVQILTKYNVSPAKQLNIYCMCASSMFYAALGCRMLWIKYKSSSPSISGESIAEKDSIKILIVCFSCLAMSAINQLLFDPFVTYANKNFTEAPRVAAYWAGYITQWMVYCTEEISLALLVRDFRRNVRLQLRLVFCFCCRGGSTVSSTSSNSNNTVATQQQMMKPVVIIRSVQVTKVNTLVHNN